MIRARDPGLLLPEERLREVAELLATGYRRRTLADHADCSPNRLAAIGVAEAQCAAVVNAPESAPAKESA
jgi:hypothetical protein